jgi:uncharacterized SAM-binding protein YcdF (DUF218 family)
MKILFFVFLTIADTMFFILSKILSFLFIPLVWIIALLLFALLSKNAKRKKQALLTAALLLILLSNSFLFDECMRMWEVPAAHATELQPVYDAGIILSGVLSYDHSFDRLQFNRRNDRLMQAIELYKTGRIKKLFFTGGSGSLVYRDNKESQMVKRFLTSIGIPEHDIIIEDASNNTHENAQFSKPILASNFNNGKFLLITSAFHMRRSVACFNKQEIVVTPYSVDRYSGPRKYQFDHLLVPHSETLFNWDSLIHEWVGYAVYKIVGYC